MAWKMGISPDAPIEVDEGTPGSIPGPVPSRTPDYIGWLNTSLRNYEELARKLVEHRAEKGRIVEAVVKSALRGILPDRFSIGTGFAITASGRTSNQLDLIIYDGYLNSPIILEGGTGIFPIECVYGFVEVKSSLNGNEIDKFTKVVRSVRELASEKRYVDYGTTEDERGNKVVAEKEISSDLPPRSFLFAINTDYAEIDNLGAALKKYTAQNSAHIHGLAVLEKDWFISQRAYREAPEFTHYDINSLAAFCRVVLATIQSVPMRPASMKYYLGTD